MGPRWLSVCVAPVAPTCGPAGSRQRGGDNNYHNGRVGGEKREMLEGDNLFFFAVGLYVRTSHCMALDALLPHATARCAVLQSVSAVCRSATWFCLPLQMHSECVILAMVNQRRRLACDRNGQLGPRHPIPSPSRASFFLPSLGHPRRANTALYYVQ